MREIVDRAIEELCSAFAKNGYNPTPIIDLGVLVANADGTVDERERAILRDIYQTLLETTLSAEVVDHLVTSSLEVIEAAGAEPRARLIAEILRDCDAVEPGITVALAVAFASQGLSSAERKVIERVSDAAGLERAELDAIVQEVGKHSDPDPVSVRNLLAAGPRSSR